MNIEPIKVQRVHADLLHFVFEKAKRSNLGDGEIINMSSRQALGLARASRINMTVQLAYGSYLAQLRSEPAPVDLFPRRQ